MHDGMRSKLPLKLLVTLSAVISGMLLMIVGGMIPAALWIPGFEKTSGLIEISSNWQVASLLSIGIIIGPSKGMMAAIAYLTIGLFYLPIFSDGGGFSYLSSPNFGYLLAFIPSVWIVGKLSRKSGMSTFRGITFCSVVGLTSIHIFGIVNIIIGSLGGRWGNSLGELLLSYTILPFPSQLILCPAIGLFSLFVRNIIFIK